MPEYLIVKKERCPSFECEDGWVTDYTNEGGTNLHELCNGEGFIRTEVSLLDVLKQLRWDVPAEGAFDPRIRSNKQFENLRLEDK